MAFYSTATIGATIHLHYCMNKLSSWSWEKKDNKKCGKCGMSTKGCCKEEAKQIKLDTEQQKTETSTLSPLHWTIVSETYSYNVVPTCIDTQIGSQYLSKPPPPISKYGLQVLYSNFRI